MPFFLLALGLVIFLVLPTVTHRVARKRLTEQVERVRGWQNLPTAAERETCIWEFIRNYYRLESLRWMIATSITVAGLAFIAGSLWWIHDVAENANSTAESVEQQAGDVAGLAAGNCILQENFYRDEADDTDREIRALSADIGDLERRLAAGTAEIQDTPGYAESPDWFREFLFALIEQQNAEDETDLAEMKAELQLLRDREDQFSELLGGTSCAERFTDDG